MSVRSRLEQQERKEIEEKLDFTAPVRPRSSTTNQAGTGRSTRSHADEERLKDEVTKATEFTRSGWTSNNETICVRTRDRQRIAKEQAEIDHPTAPTPQNAGDRENERCRLSQLRLAEIAKAGAERRRKAQEAADAAQRAAEAKRQADAAARLAEFNITATMADASANEVARVKAIIAANYPDQKLSPEKHWMVLQNLRAAIGRS